MKPDEALVQAFARRGDKDALAELVSRHRDRAYSMALRILGDASAAEDAIQDAFVRLIRSARTFRPTGSFRAWMTRIVVNACRDMKRKRRRSKAREEKRVAEGKEEAGAAEKAEEKEAAEALEMALAGLSDAQRIPIVLHYMQGLTQAEVAGILGRPQTTISSRIKAGLEGLRRKLGEVGFAAVAGDIPSLLEAAPKATAPASLCGVLESIVASASVGPGAIGLALAWLKASVAAKCLTGALVAGTAAVVIVVSTVRKAEEPPPQPKGSEAAMTFPRPPVATCVSEGVRFLLREVQFERKVDAEKGQTERFNLHCKAERALRTELGLMVREVAIDEAVDETGRDLRKVELPRRPHGFRPDWTREGPWSFTMSFNLPDARAKRIARVRGRARFLAVTKEMRISFAEPASAQGSSRAKEGHTARLEDFRTFGDRVTIKVFLTFPAEARRAPPRPRPRARAIPTAPAEVQGLRECVSFALLTAEGREILAQGFGRSGDLKQMAYEVSFPVQSATVASLDLVIAREGKWIEIPFEFTDFPVPGSRPSIVQGPRREGPTEIRTSSELFKLSLERVTREERQELSGRYGGIQVQGMARFHKDARVLAVSDFVRISAATDDRGQRVTSAVGPEEGTFDELDEGEADVWMVFSGAHPEATEIVSLKGELGLWLEEEHDQLTFDLGAGLPQKKISGKVSVELQKLRKEEKRGGYSLGDVVILTFMSSGLPGAEFPGWWQYPTCRLFDTEGRQFEQTGRSVQLVGGRMLLELTCRRGESPPARAVFDYAKKARLVWVPFELKRIPIPWAEKREPPQARIEEDARKRRTERLRAIHREASELQKQGKHAEAIAKCEEVVSLVKASPEDYSLSLAYAYERLARAHAEAGEYVRAAEAVVRAKEVYRGKNPPDVQISYYWQNAAEKELEAGDIERGVKLLRKATSASPVNSRAHEMLIRALFRAGRRDRVPAAARAFAEGTGEVVVRQRSYGAKAKTVERKASQLRVEASYCQQQGDAWALAGERDKAEACYASSLELIQRGRREYGSLEDWSYVPKRVQRGRGELRWMLVSHYEAEGTFADVAIAKDGRIFLLESGEPPQVHVRDASGRHLRRFTLGVPKLQRQDVDALAVDKDGRLCLAISGRGKKKLLAYSAEGKLLLTREMEEYTKNLDLNEKGQLVWLTSGGNFRTLETDFSTAAATRVFTAPGEWLHAGKFCSALDGKIFVLEKGLAERQRVWRLSPFLEVESSFGTWGPNPGEMCECDDIAVDLAGRILLAGDEEPLRVFDESGLFLGEVPEAQGRRIVMGPDGAVYVLGRSLLRIPELRPEDAYSEGHGLALQKYHAGDFDGALKLLRELPEDDAMAPHLYVMLARILHEEGKLEEAAKAAEEAAHRNPGAIAPCRALSEIRLSQGRPEPAAQALERPLEGMPESKFKVKLWDDALALREKFGLFERGTFVPGTGPDPEAAAKVTECHLVASVGPDGDGGGRFEKPQQVRCFTTSGNRFVVADGETVLLFTDEGKRVGRFKLARREEVLALLSGDRLLVLKKWPMKGLLALYDLSGRELLRFGERGREPGKVWPGIESGTAWDAAEGGFLICDRQGRSWTFSDRGDCRSAARILTKDAATPCSDGAGHVLVYDRLRKRFRIYDGVPRLVASAEWKEEERPMRITAKGCVALVSTSVPGRSVLVELPTFHVLARFRLDPPIDSYPALNDRLRVAGVSDGTGKLHIYAPGPAPPPRGEDEF